MKRSDPASQWLNQGLAAASAFIIFVTAPLLARFILQLRRMPEGEVRDALVQVCRDHHVRVRDVLLWETDGSMINAAVMGLFGFLRYVMITDALLDSLRREQVIAVMAHEVGHVRRRHIPWMIVAIFAAISLPTAAIAALMLQFNSVWIEHAGLAASLLIAFVVFGWISRRFERQADTFAAQHLSGLRARNDEVESGAIITPHATEAMQQALESVARLNGMNPARNSWRHGSIRWRQDHLSRINGKPIGRIPIDRQIRAIKLASLIALIIAISIIYWVDSQERDRARSAQFRVQQTEFKDELLSRLAGLPPSRE